MCYCSLLRSGALKRVCSSTYFPCHFVYLCRFLPPQETLSKGYPATVSWTSIEFSPDDRFIAAATSDRGVLILDSFAPQRELARE